MLVLTNLAFSFTPFGILIGSSIFQIDPYYHLLQHNLPIYITDKMAYRFISVFFRCVLVSGFSEFFRHACIVITGLGLMWGNCFTSMTILTLCDNTDCVTSLLDYHCKIVLCYAITHQALEKLLAFGSSGIFWLLVFCISLVFLLQEILPKIILLFLLVLSLLAGYCFLCGMGFVASSNYGSELALQACYFQACKNNGNDHVRFQRKIERKRAKSYRPLKIPYQPLGPLDKAFQVDYVNTLKDRVVDVILLKE